MGLRFDPMGGGQFKQAIQTIIEAERQPIKSIQARKTTEESRMKLFQEFKGKFAGIEKSLAEFTDFRKFRELKVDLGDGEKYIGVTVDKERAEPGSYTLQVDQLAARSSVITNGFKDPDEKVLGIGFIIMELANGETKEIYVDEKNASLHGVAGLINHTPNSPVQASVVKDLSDPDNPWRLIMSARKDGNDDAIQYPELYFLDGREDIYYDDEKESENSLIQLDGFPIEADGNQIKDFLQGVNLHLKQARPDMPFTVTISEDTQKVAGKVKALVEQVNGILEFINKQNQVDDKTDTRSSFAGDTSLQNIEYRIRNLLHEGFPVGDPEGENFRFVFINQLGVEFNRNGMIDFKEDKFAKILEDDFNGVSEAITGPFGFASQFKEVMRGYTRSNDGILTLREQGLKSRIASMDDQIAQKERRIEQRTRALTDQFSRLQGSLAAMQQQQQYLSATLGGGGGNIVSQLLG